MKIAATADELHMIRDNDPAEQNLKKSTILSLETFEQLCKTIKKPEYHSTLVALLKSVVSFSFFLFSLFLLYS